MAETRREAIRRIYERSGLGALWRWAKRGTGKRWEALQHWAADRWHRTKERVWRDRASIYARKKRRWLERHPDTPPPVAQGIVTFDGKPCAAWIARHLQAVRNAGRWKGVLVSGYRTPEYSRQLCRNMCGADSCPGRCAGVTSNHTRFVQPEGAVDVSDYYTFGAECRRLGIPLHNALGAQDPVHFSSSGR